MEQQQPYTEYKLKAILHKGSNRTKYHVMNVKSFGPGSDLRDFSTPISLTREKGLALTNSLSNDEDEEDTDEEVPKKRGMIGRSMRKRTRILNPYQVNAPALAAHEVTSDSATAIPFLLEDFDRQNSLVGRIEGGQRSNYVFLVNHGNEFRVLPVDKWYRFTPRNTGDVLGKKDGTSHVMGPVPPKSISLEDAEKAMKHKTRREEAIWKHRFGRKVQNTDDEQVDTKSSNVASITPKTIVSHQDEMDFDEIFEDDLSTDDSQEGDNGSYHKENVLLSNSGREMQTILRSLDKDTFTSGHFEHDPYAVLFWFIFSPIRMMNCLIRTPKLPRSLQQSLWQV